MSDRINELSRSLRPDIAAVVAFGVAINLLYLAAPIYVVQVYNRVLTSQSIETLVALSAIVALAIGAIAVLDSARVLLVRRLGERIDVQLLEFDAARHVASRDAPARLRADRERIVRFFAPSGLIALLDFPWVLIYAAVLFLMHPLFGAITLMAAIAIIAVALLMRTSAVDARRAAEADERAKSLALRWEGRERQAIALGVWTGHAESHRAAHEDRAACHAGVYGRSAVAAAANRGIRLAFLCIAIGCGAWLVIGGAIGPATMFAASMLVARALVPVEAGVAAACETPKARAAWRRLHETASAPTPVLLAGHAVDATRGVELARLSYRAQGSVTSALANLTVSLPPGEVLGVLGPSGAGKSLLASLVAGALLPSAGRARFGGVDTTALAATPGRRLVGYLPQERERLEGTIAEAIAGGADADADDIVDAAERAGLSRYVESLPLGLNTPLNDGRCSAGICQQIAIARAIRGRPLLVVLDEPTVHLDAQAERALVDAIAALRSGGSSIVVTSHRISAIGIADRLLILRDGRMETLGLKSDVLEALARRSLRAIPERARQAEALA